MHPLDGPRARIETANRAIQTLAQAFRDTFTANPHRIVIAESDPETGNFALRVAAGLDELPTAWGVTIGEVAHNLRAALDGVAWQLGRDNGWSETALDERRPQFGFPIFAESGAHSRAWCAREVAKRIEPLRSADAALVSRLQPFERGNLNEQSPLWMLHQLNNSDKHRLITVVNVVPSGYTAQGLWAEMHMDRMVALRPNAKVGWIRPPAPNAPGARPDGAGGGGVWLLNPDTGELNEPYLYVDFKVTPAVLFGDSCRALQGFSVVPTLASMASEVSRVVETFVDSFGNSEPD